MRGDDRGVSPSGSKSRCGSHITGGRSRGSCSSATCCNEAAPRPGHVRPRGDPQHPLSDGYVARSWHFEPAIAGAGLIYDVGSHAFDLLDFFFGPIAGVGAFAVNSGGAYAPEDVTAAAFGFASGAVGTASFNFNAFEKSDRLVLVGTNGEISTPVFSTDDVVLRRTEGTERVPVPWPPHVHQPLIQTIVDELQGRGRCESTGESGARAQWVLDRCVERFRRG